MTASAEGAAPRKITLVPYDVGLRDAIADFNRRLDAGGAALEFRLEPEPVSSVFPDPTRGVHDERLIAVDEDGVVRGGVYLQVQPFQVGGEITTVANAQLPLSEGIVDRKYAYLGMWLIKQVVRRYPRAFSIGMGGVERPLPQLMKAMGWTVWSIPFLFQIVNVSRAVREIPALGSEQRRRLASTALRFTGAGLLGGAAWRAASAWRTRGTPRLSTHEVREWDAWADAVWESARGGYGVIAVRDAKTLGALFDPRSERFRPYRLDDPSGRPVGWVVVSLRQNRGSAHFGDLNVGAIIDALVLPGHEVGAIRAATRILVERGADVVVTNQSHPAWIDACRLAAFRGTRSNYALAASAKLVSPKEDPRAVGVQFTRGDGDGRIHL